jgi:N-acetylglucosamine-6-phosphate deacetylase
MLAAVRAARFARPAGSSRVLPAHLESNFINPEYRGAQPLDCLSAGRWRRGGRVHRPRDSGEIAAARPDVGIVTIAPEIDGAIPLIRSLAAHGHHVSLDTWRDLRTALEGTAGPSRHPSLQSHDAHHPSRTAGRRRWSTTT